MQLFSDANINRKIHQKIAQLIAILYKAEPLPIYIAKDVIDNLKDNNDFEELCRLAECAGIINLVIYDICIFIIDIYFLNFTYYSKSY